MGKPQGADRVRQVIVFVLSIVAIAAAFVGSGALGGTPMQEAADGAFSDDATLIAPAGPAFSIWSVIYAGLLAYAVWQALPGQAARAVHRRVGYLVALSMLLNAAWLAVVQLGQVGLSVVVIVVLLAVLGVTFSRLQRMPREAGSQAARITESIVLDGTVGLYLGWVTIATAANITAWLVDTGFTGFGIPADGWGVAVVIAAAVLGIATAIAGRGRLTPAIGLAWGLCWLAVARLTGEPQSTPVALAALVASAAVILTAAVLRVLAQGGDAEQHGGETDRPLRTQEAHR
ncbi:tryptophan-rich sensory protein [Microbacterium sp. H1-D42]|uniref:tryptophan-rich sensory protein n=1 Tax=Microbacterium sp. H1-D42 TaxID=2925844 RepID=UPI001F531F25|nr:tryptophan-rich sensory protein [Microbacterium sp. H1-D42]UNK71456.1 tryptophan-rich sensory protein [Microbacterium sp. H1-D42]